MASAPRFDAVLEALVVAGVDFMVVGGVASVLEGAPITTFDLDIVHERSDANVERLAAALRTLDAKHRDLGGRTLLPDPATLRGPDHHLFLTSHGPLDVLGMIGTGGDYLTLLAETESISLGTKRVRVLGLAAPIRTKEAAGRRRTSRS